MRRGETSKRGGRVAPTPIIPTSHKKGVLASTRYDRQTLGKGIEQSWASPHALTTQETQVGNALFYSLVNNNFFLRITLTQGEQENPPEPTTSECSGLVGPGRGEVAGMAHPSGVGFRLRDPERYEAYRCPCRFKGGGNNSANRATQTDEIF